EAQFNPAGLILLGLQFESVIQIEVSYAILRSQLDLRTVDVVFVAVHDGPNGLLTQRPPAGEDSITQHGCKRLPIAADQEWRDRALDGCYTAGRLRISWRDPIPDAPDVLPTFPANAIKKGELQIICLVTIPPIRDVHHVARFQPFVAIYPRCKWEFVLAPG